jgi:glycosyltransferase involved in cell wall biosynthesis
MLTTSDSGGVLEIVLNKETGLVVPPQPKALASAMDRLFLERKRAQELGRAGRDLWSRKTITWPATIERLLS